MSPKKSKAPAGAAAATGIAAPGAKRPRAAEPLAPVVVVKRRYLRHLFAGVNGSAETYAGVWRELTVNYADDAGDKDPCAIFKDKRCQHIAKLQINDINGDIAKAIALLPELTELHVRKLGSVFYGDRMRRTLAHGEAVVNLALPANLWPRLRTLIVTSFKARCDAGGGGNQPELMPRDRGDWHYEFRVGDEVAIALADAAPNVRRLRIDWTYRLECLPALQELTLFYAVADFDEDRSVPLTICEPLDAITPAALQYLVLVDRQQPHRPPHYRDEDGRKSSQRRDGSLVRLAAALVRMQHRAPHRFDIHLCGELF